MDKVKANNQYRIMNKKHNISNEEWELCKQYFNHQCAYCGLNIEEHYIKFNGKIQLGDFHKEHFDHNGSNELDNCVPSCKECNSSKGDKEFEYWYKIHPKFTYERLNKISKWLDKDYKKYIEIPKLKSVL